MDTSELAFPKPEPRARTKRRKHRTEAQVIQEIRALCVARDGDCRLQGATEFPPCGGVSEWAHLEDRRRARTQGMPPKERHTTGGSLMLCTEHHRAYDAHRLRIRCLTGQQADGLLGFWVPGDKDEVIR